MSEFGRSSRSSVAVSGAMKVLVCARFLGRLILEAQQDEGREYFASEATTTRNCKALPRFMQTTSCAFRTSEFSGVNCSSFSNHDNKTANAGTVFQNQYRRGPACNRFSFNPFASPPSTPSDEDKATQNVRLYIIFPYFVLIPVRSH